MKKFAGEVNIVVNAGHKSRKATGYIILIIGSIYWINGEEI